MYWDDDHDARFEEAAKQRRIAEYKQRIKQKSQQLTGHYTGRCGKCGSSDLWDDVTMYGCNSCNAMFSNM